MGHLAEYCAETQFRLSLDETVIIVIVELTEYKLETMARKHSDCDTCASCFSEKKRLCLYLSLVFLPR